MALFLDSVDLDKIAPAMELGLFAGVTTNPKLFAHIEPDQRLEHLASIAKICRGSLYIQVDLDTPEAMENQALTLREVAPGRCIIKAPMSEAGLNLVARLRPHKLPVCLTAAFSALQAVAAGAVAAHAVALYLGRIDRAGGDGQAALRDAAAALKAAGKSTRVLAASIADETALLAAMQVPGIDLTIPAHLLPKLIDHPGTTDAIEEFETAGRMPPEEDLTTF